MITYRFVRTPFMAPEVGKVEPSPGGQLRQKLKPGPHLCVIQMLPKRRGCLPARLATVLPILSLPPQAAGTSVPFQVGPGLAIMAVGHDTCHGEREDRQELTPGGSSCDQSPPEDGLTNNNLARSITEILCSGSQTAWELGQPRPLWFLLPSF